MGLLGVGDGLGDLRGGGFGLGRELPGQFSPDLTTSRGMIVTILYRLEGSPAVSGGATFADVSSGQWYSDGVA